MYEVCTEASFSAAHHLRDYDGPCENVHGHNWLVKVTVRCRELNEAGIGVDFRTLKAALSAILSELDHTYLNQVLGETGLNPSSENIARHIYGRLQKAIGNENCRVARVEVCETPGNSASYFEDVDDQDL
jgi:6-pyruvoyltetrahydropterin/6-carboxytetrahydropterin synthase